MYIAVDYAPPPEVEPREGAAVWRVAWTGALAWAAGIACWFGPDVWGTFAVAGTIDWGWIGIGYTAASIGLLACAAAILVGRIARAGPATVKWIGFLGLAMVLGYVFFQSVANLSRGGRLTAYTVILCALIFVSRAGGLVLLTAVAFRPARATAARMALLTAAVLMTTVCEYAFGIGSIVFEARFFAEARENLLMRGWMIEHARYGLTLAAAVMLILAAPSAHRHRWPFVAAAIMVLVALLGGSLAQYTVGFWGIQLTIPAIASALGANLVIASPAAGLLAWRPGGRSA